MKCILIANRGEIAARIIRTCKKMDIKTIAIYSEADQLAPYVSMADESYLIGGNQVNESYMNMDKIFQIAKEHEVDGIHPGYGFMSENSTFAKKCEEEGITFIGPSGSVMEQMGDKITARNMMEKVGVPIAKGTTEAIPTLEKAKEIAKKIGYPVMLKASAGGGGIGMQVVHDEQTLKTAFENNTKRAQMFFGNGAMYMEKYIGDARHIEIQLLADQHGNVVHFFERECSIQRRNQKVIEEARAIYISESTRNKMATIAVEAIKKIGYTNAGTMEFLVDKDENFYFLEMNTRIQVEHPVTEEITGYDLIEQQIRIARGETLSFNQSDITAQNHSIEVRIYAEDPTTFFPSPGTITTYIEPHDDPNVRMESAVTEGYQVTPFYDPMIAKVIVTKENRHEAIKHLIETLQNYKIEGIKTNIPMILSVLQDKAFQEGAITIHYVEQQV
ncbi:MAG TPA: acetyl-CoA carboxylase biotin carboxylase subunit [Candidatus Pseudogracilibacillus intestinigallinarum]|uniref:biotin carboxylase n=1 Tax=Candidatus Pseudogracilibacillus intestinigallinarum TaxID=2838742 RepID=A0A9D1PNK1_9BACI|nr:acetyl-CoA carboxylase biotin carboxylase subunit [Candidatus Pseudogracilibacillus intestinigallinarum]